MEGKVKRWSGRAREAGVHESIEQFRLAQEALGIVTWIWDIGTDRVQWYGDISRLLGLPPRGFAGRFPDYLKQVHPDDVAAAKRTFIECMKGTSPEYRTLERVIWPNRSVHWLETYGRASYGPDGRAVRLTGVIKEVTERKQQESARLKAEKQLARVFDASPDYIVIVRAGDGMFLAANPAFERITGYRAEEIVGRTVGELNIWAIPGERERFIADLHKGGGSLQNRPTLLRTRSGAIVSGRLSASIVEHEGEQLIISLMHDATQAKRLERRAHQSERKFAALFETSPVGQVVTKPRERRIVEVNDAALRMLGLERDQVVGALTDDVVQALDREAIEALRARALAGEPIIGRPAGFVRRDGRQVDCLLSLALIELEGEPHFVISLVDITEQHRLERQRQQAERKYEALFTSNPDAVVVTRLRDGLILAQNDACERHSGYPRDRVVGRSVLELGFWVRADDRAAVLARLESDGRVSNVETRFRRADGREIDVLLSVARVEIETEACAIWSWRDISDMRAAERRARESDARYGMLFRSALEGIFIAGADDVIIDANPSACALTGYSRTELVGMHGPRLFSERELAARPFRSGGSSKWQPLERALTRKDGSEVLIEMLAGPMPDDNVLAIMRDITERKRNETLLMNVARGVSAELGEAFFRSLAGHLARELGADFAFVGELTGHDPEQVRTLAFVADGATLAPADHPLAGSMTEQALAHGRTVMFAQGVRERFPGNADMQREGVEAYVGTPLYGADGKAIGVLAVGHRKPLERPQFWASMIEIFGARAAAEIERARAEALVRRTNESLEQTVHERTAELEEANRELESYSYSISHDLRQPLNAIAGFAELLHGHVPAAGSAAAECVAEIESNATRMEQMIESLLRLSRAGRGALRREPVDAARMVEAVVHDLSAAAPLTAKVVVGELPAAHGDPVLLRQVWTNLIGNAVKYSRRSPVPCVEISGVRRNGAVEYTVSDNGVGFDMQHAVRLFGTFQRLPTAAGFEGSGVGLAIVERIVRRHGGTINAQSVPGAGASFRFTLPDAGLS